MTIEKLKKRIEELRKQKDEIISLIEENGWLYNQRPNIIPKFTDSMLGFDMETIEPERRSISEKAISVYQRWFSSCKAIIENHQINRLKEYEGIYSPTAKGSLPGIKSLFNDRLIPKEEQYRLIDLIEDQFNIINAIPNYIEDKNLDIELTAYSVIFDDEIEESTHLLKKGFLRAAGAVAGVVLERHLKNLLRKHNPPIRYAEKAGLSLVNDKCKENTIYDVPTWRKIQHLTDLRNLCDHDKEREPTKDEVDELIRGVSKIIKTINITID